MPVSPSPSRTEGRGPATAVATGQPADSRGVSGPPPAVDGKTGELAEGLRIALLDDDEGLLETLSATLEAYGIRVCAFRHPGEMLEASGRESFDAFVMDWRLGDVTAGPAIYALRALPAYARAPIFILTGNIPVVDTDWDRELADLLGRHQVQYRAKPYRTRDLARELEQSVANTKP